MTAPTAPTGLSALEAELRRLGDGARAAGVDDEALVYRHCADLLAAEIARQRVIVEASEGAVGQ